MVDVLVEPAVADLDRLSSAERDEILWQLHGVWHHGIGHQGRNDANVPFEGLGQLHPDVVILAVEAAASLRVGRRQP